MGADFAPQDRWRVDPRTAWTRAQDGTAVVMDMASGLPLRLSPSGSVIWEFLLDGRSPQEQLAAPPPAPFTTEAVVDGVAAAFDESPETVAPGVADLLRTLAERGILLPLPSSPDPSEGTP